MCEELNFVVLAELLELWRNDATGLSVDLQNRKVKVLVVKYVEDRFQIHVRDSELSHCVG